MAMSWILDLIILLNDFISNLITNYLHYVIFDTSILKSKILAQSSTLVNEIASDDEGTCHIRM